jgi:hypothetical protein
LKLNYPRPAFATKIKGIFTDTALYQYAGVPHRKAIAPFRSQGDITVLKKTCVAGGMLIATTAGAIITSLPAFAAAPSFGGGCCSSSHSRFGHFSRNRSWNGNENESLNRIRLRIHNRNNNIAVARTNREDRERDRHRWDDPGAGAPIVGAPGV